MSILTLQGVSKSFGGLKAVNDVSFTLEEHRVTSLVGPNGAGKTTIFNLITGFLPIDAGHIYFQDKEITGVSPHKITNLGVTRRLVIL